MITRWTASRNGPTAWIRRSIPLVGSVRPMVTTSGQSSGTSQRAATLRAIATGIG